jgi:hypothetical protein
VESDKTSSEVADPIGRSPCCRSPWSQQVDSSVTVTRAFPLEERLARMAATLLGEHLRGGVPKPPAAFRQIR